MFSRKRNQFPLKFINSSQWDVLSIWIYEEGSAGAQSFVKSTASGLWGLQLSAGQLCGCEYQIANSSAGNVSILLSPRFQSRLRAGVEKKRQVCAVSAHSDLLLGLQLSLVLKLAPAALTRPWHPALMGQQQSFLQAESWLAHAFWAEGLLVGWAPLGSGAAWGFLDQCACWSPYTQISLACGLVWFGFVLPFLWQPRKDYFKVNEPFLTGFWSLIPKSNKCFTHLTNIYWALTVCYFGVCWRYYS